MKGKIIIAVIIALIAVIAGIVIFVNATKDNTWTHDWSPGEATGAWGEQIILTYEDGSTETLNNILGNTGPLSISYGGQVITGMTYVLNGKASQSGSDYNEAIVDFTGGKLVVTVISNTGYVALWDFNSDGVINAVDTASITGKMGQTGAPGWIKEDINYDGAISTLDTNIFLPHVGATTGTGVVTYENGGTKTGTDTIPLTGTWTQLYSYQLSLVAYNLLLPDGTYVLQCRMTGGIPQYRAHSTVTNFYSDWISASYPWDKDIVITVSHGTLTFIFGTAITTP
ncbi:MAG: hypothetical protein IMZ64_06205 [Bacteroidetes bacterium]|nr:hypothetical protein [Bacteroidota bacterium]